MKYLIYLLLAFPLFSHAQKIQNVKTKAVIELKESVAEYCCVVMQPQNGRYGFFIEVNELGFWKCIDLEGKPIEFSTIVAVMNYLSENGWEYINNIGGSDGAAPQYYFKKKKSM